MQFKIPQMGFFFTSETNVKFIIAFVALMIALWWANKNHRRRNAQIKQEEKEDKIIIVVSTIVFICLSIVVYRAFNQFSEALNWNTFVKAMNEEGNELGVRPINGTTGLVTGGKLSYWDRLKLWLSGWRNLSKKDYKTLVLETAIYGVVATIIILLILICYPSSCRSCNTDSDDGDYHNHPVPNQGMVIKNEEEAYPTTASEVPKVCVTPLQLGRQSQPGEDSRGQQESSQLRASLVGEETRGDNRTPPEDLTNIRRA